MLLPLTGAHSQARESRLRTSQSSVHDSSVLPRMSALMAAMVAPDEASRT
jgi:hypothetical protein